MQKGIVVDLLDEEIGRVGARNKPFASVREELAAAMRQRNLSGLVIARLAEPPDRVFADQVTPWRPTCPSRASGWSSLPSGSDTIPQLTSRMLGSTKLSGLTMECCRPERVDQETVKAPALVDGHVMGEAFWRRMPSFHHSTL